MFIYQKYLSQYMDFAFMKEGYSYIRRDLSSYIKIHDNRDVGNLNNEVIFEIRKGKTNEKNS